ncbi:hypothetical protein EUTSA_v10008538mg [Eutrema salsugineum]|uniref:Uncharacterized protein n=1 Tax=Eutrema salsugineum TaxID=72664 RepID=V4KZK6_EUTSA|nr:uncharacterized protein LOC18994701 [Eutrema salsugineum]ESQ36804.1 hypothetical protein EUTSA_v10008538mg [Eutrema salsugineum]
MEKSTSTSTSTSTAAQIAEPPPSATSSLSAQDLSLPPTADQRSSPPMVAAELPSLAVDLDSSPSLTPGAAAQPHSGAQVPPPPLIATTDPSSRGRKRALEGNVQIDNSNYYKLRLLVKDLRPQVLEVLRTPDFRNSKAAIDIQEKMKLILELYQEMIGGAPKREKTTKSESLSNGKAINQTPQSTSTELRSSKPISVQTDKHNSDGDADKVVGGSAFGWNFVTYGGTEAVYSGMSKEDYRGSHPIIQAEAEVDNTL